ncbi:MAG: bis(5'-nucleosyl)-tetraphosphatase (symmetrical) YqeK [Raoultibacter sp.]
MNAIEEPFGDENYHRMKKLLQQRVGTARYKHSVGVAKTAAQLAKMYSYDVGEARMAGLVHDWNKACTHQEERAQVAAFGLSVDAVVLDQMPWLLHGPTAAAVLARDYPELGPRVCQAAARHTSASTDMAPLDMIVYIADLIEPGRVFQDIGVVRAAVGQVSLEELFFLALKQIIAFLVEHNRLMHPATMEVWNYYVVRMPTAQKGRLAPAGLSED